MGVEDFDFIDDLNPSFPLGSDDVSEGDDHIRGVKLTLQNAFPSNDGPGQFPDMDFTMRDLAARNVTVGGQILANEQVAIALTTIDGITGTITGPNIGVDAVQHSADGIYDFLLTEKDWTSTEDLQIGFNVNYILFGAGVAVMGASPNGAGWIRVQTIPSIENQPLDWADCALLHIVVFDAGRDFPT